MTKNRFLKKVFCTAVVLCCVFLEGSKAFPKEAAGKPKKDDLREMTIPDDAIAGETFERMQSGYLMNRVKYTVEGQHVGTRFYYHKREIKTPVLAIEVTYLNGKLHGYWKQYYKSGKKYLEVPYRDGLVDGTLTYWKKDGTVFGKSRLVKGNGIWTSYSQEWGERSRQVTPFRNGVKHGVVMAYGQFNDDGLGVNVTEYFNGKANGFSQLYDQDGTLRSEAYLAKGTKHGVVRKWNRKGKLLEGYPKFYLIPKKKTDYDPRGIEVSGEEYRKAAKSDPVLLKSLFVPKTKRISRIY